MKHLPNANITFGITIFLCGIGFLALSPFLDNFKPMLRARGFLSVKTAIILAIFLLTYSSIHLIIGIYQITKLRRLKKIGKKYEAVITKIVWNFFPKVNRKKAGHAECRYINEEGISYLVKSSPFPIIKIERHRYEEQYNAIVYINTNNHNDYAVEIFVYTK